MRINLIPYGINRKKWMRGLAAEARFKAIMEKAGWKVRESNIYEDTKLHIDFWCENEKTGEKFSVDVKASKRICAGYKSSRTHTWLELHGNGEKNDGWLFNGQNDIIAFEKILNDFMFISRAKLAAKISPIAQKLFKNNKILNNPVQAVKTMCIYRRKGFEAVLWYRLKDMKECEAHIDLA